MELKVPFGERPDGALISVESARRNEQYRCPSCYEVLVLKAGEERIKHFSHPANTTCSQESILHLTAKKLLVQAIRLHAGGDAGGKILLSQECQDCGDPFSRPLPERTFTSAALEYKLESYYVDVIAFQNEKPRLAIEVRATHAVDAKKATELPLYWIELLATDVLARPNEWRPIASRLKSKSCKSCSEKVAEILELAEKYQIDSSCFTPLHLSGGKPFVAAAETCFKCKERIPVFWWRGVPFAETAPPSPHPHTIKFRFSKTHGEKYWANTCPNCNRLQGDHFLHLSGDAVFGHLPMHEAAFGGGRSAVFNLMSGIIDRNFGRR